MKRRLPPFAAVRAFEAAARHMSVQQAADELCLTPSAVSHQVRALEDFLNTALFERHGNRIVLTLTGQAYAGRLTNLLDDFDAATQELSRIEDRQLRVLCTPGFAARWLAPRMGALPYARGLRLRVSTGAPSLDFATNDADVVIQWASADTPGLLVEPLMQSDRYPVAAPDFVEENRIEKPGDLFHVPLMQDETDDAWSEWFSTAGLKLNGNLDGPVFPNCEFATTAAERGEGVSLAYHAMVRRTLDSGRLIRLFDSVTMPFVIYSVAFPEHRADDELLRHFADWLHTEARAEGVSPS